MAGCSWPFKPLSTRLLPRSRSISFTHIMKNRRSIERRRIKQEECLLIYGDPWENRTPVCGVRGRRLDRLTNGPRHGGDLTAKGIEQPRGAKHRTPERLLRAGRLFSRACRPPLSPYKKRKPAPTYFRGSSPTNYLRHDRA